MPIYEYRCGKCGRRTSALLTSYSSPDPVCPHCGKPGLHRLVSTFATVHSGDDGDHDDVGSDGDSGGDGLGEGDDYGSGGFDDGDDF